MVITCHLSLQINPIGLLSSVSSLACLHLRNHSSRPLLSSKQNSSCCFEWLLVYPDSTQPWWRGQGDRYRNFSCSFFIQPLVKCVFIGVVRILDVSGVSRGTAVRTQRFRQVTLYPIASKRTEVLFSAVILYHNSTQSVPLGWDSCYAVCCSRTHMERLSE